MYNKKILLAIAFFSLTSILYSCSESSGSATVSSHTSGSASDNKIHFTVNGKPVETSGWNISRFDMGQGVGLNITSNMHEDKRTIAFNINGYLPGTYQISSKILPNSAYGDYKPDYTDLLNSYSFAEGTINIISIDTVKGLLNANFSGTVVKGEESFSISNGKIINGKLKSGITKY
jgi:hypothetical protein